MFAVVNGYPCNSTCDVAVARRNIDPRNPRNDPAKAEQLAEADVMKGKTPKDTGKVPGVEAAAETTLTPKRLLDVYA